MPEKFHPIVEYILSYENDWCNKMSFYNPYSDPWPQKISKNMPDFDGQAFRKYRKHNFIYDKLLIAKTQGIHSGTLESLLEKQPKYIKYPIFIKPRYGHKSASSKNCFKIISYEDLDRYKNIPEMMWSEFIPETEGMTDYFIHNGNIVHQITYVYSETQHGTIADDWKFISSKSKPPTVIDNWVRENMKGFSGACNVQYRGTKIIEVGLRLARGGAYIYSTNNETFIKAINDLVNHNRWNYSLSNDDLMFKDYYSFKCYTTTPIIYLYPQYVLDSIMKANNCKEFYEYYFEPEGKGFNMVSFQFLHEDFDKGMVLKKQIENVMNTTQIAFILLFLIAILIMFYYDKYIGIISFLVISFLFSTRFLNPLSMHANLYVAQKQAIFG